MESTEDESSQDHENMITIDRSLIDLSQDQKNAIMHVGNDTPIIFIGMGSCGIAAGGHETLQVIKRELKTNNWDAKIIKVGCIGACYCEPIVDIKMPGRTRVSFKNVDKNQAKHILDTMFKGNIEEIHKRDLLGQYINNIDEFYEYFPSISSVNFFKKQKKFVLSRCGIIDPENIMEYISYEDGYHALAKVLETNDPKWVIDEIKNSGLRGRGGAGFPTGLKWDFARKSKSKDGIKYIIMNADEGDPGAFMNRAELESDPYSALEGMTIAGYAVGATEGFIYCRAEYPLVIERLQNAIEIARVKGLLGKNIMGSGFDFDISIKAGAGAFVCGEETALLRSIESSRGQPDIKPPYPTTSGLYGKPTVINNVETLHQIAKIISIGADKFSSWGTDKSKGTKVFSLTGKIRKSGLVEVPMGTTIREIIDIGGGILDGGEFKAAQCGGPSGGCVPKEFIDTSVDYESLKEVGAIMGSGGLVIMDNETCMVDTARYFMEFIQSESCGKCIPCREGTKRLLEILESLTIRPKTEEQVIKRMQNMQSMIELAEVIKETALCGLGMTAPNPVLSTLKYFRDEYEAHLYYNKCPAKQCLGLVTFSIDTQKCTGCGLCKIKCPANAIIGEKRQAHYVIDEKCLHCGLCYENCNFKAVNRT